MSRYGFLRMKFLLVVLPIIALSFLVHASFDVRINFAEQIAVDILDLRVLTDSAGIDNKLSKKLDKYLDSSLDAVDQGIEELLDEQDKSQKPKKSKKSEKSKKSKKSKKDSPGDKDFRRAQQNLDRYLDTVDRELEHGKISQAQFDALEPVAVAINGQFSQLLNDDFENRAPAADAGADQAVAVGQMVTLDGSGSSDADGDALSYQWSLTPPTGSTAVLSAVDSATPSLVPDLPGAYIVELVVSDGLIDSEPDSVTVNAATPNTRPVANAGADQTGTVGQTITLDGSASSDADGDGLSFSWALVNLPADSLALLDAPASVMPTFVADIAGTYQAELVVNDGLANSALSYVMVNISIPNTPPVGNAGAAQSVSVGANVQLDGSQSSDIDGDSLSWF